MEKVRIVIAVDTTEAGNALRNAAHSHGLEVILEQAPGPEAQAFIDRIARLHAEIVFIEIPRSWGPQERVIELLSAAAGTAAVVVVHPNPEPETILEAIRAGASELIYPPFELHTGRSLEHLLQEAGASRRALAGKTLGFLSVKGGCGATTLACGIGAELQRSRGKSVLLADFDPDLGIIAFLLKTKSQYTVADALKNAERLDHSMWQAFAASALCGIGVLGAPEEPVQLAMDPRQSAHFFRFVRSEYDFTVVDLGRGLTPFNLAAMADIDFTCLVTTMEIPALHHARRTIKALLGGGAASERLRLIVNRMPRHREVTVEELEKMIEFPVYAAVSDDAEALSDAYSEDGLVSSGTQLGKEFSAIASRRTGQPEKEPPKLRLFSRA